jgi:hypothetical protein
MGHFSARAVMGFSIGKKRVLSNRQPFMLDAPGLGCSGSPARLGSLW